MTGEDGGQPTMPGGLRPRVEAWISDDPDPGDRAELRTLLAHGGAAAAAELADRFGGRLEFGTAGLRGAVGAGPNRMNRSVVRGATAALAGWLRDREPGAAAAGVVIGCDARHRSTEFADEAARVLTGAGLRVHLLPRPCPTPLLAFSVRQLSAAAGVMITASHNPAADNGYKLYLGDGAQIIPPADAQIEAGILALGPLSQVPVGSLDGPLVIRHGAEIAEAYLTAITADAAGQPGDGGPAGDNTSPAITISPTASTLPGDSTPPTASTPPGDSTPPTASTPPGDYPSPTASIPPRNSPPLRVVYTPMHGVAGPLMLAAIARAGFAAPDVVAAQADPDPDFPTVAFPNPEEPGALDLALGQARRSGADLVLASDPDGDRLAVAVPDASADGGWRRLTGDQLGALLGGYLLDQTAARPDPGGRLVVTTIVSSTMLSKVAAAAGALYAETLTGFKWIVRGGQDVPGSRFLFGYEEALGYAVGSVVRDKDGIGAALAVLGLATRERAAGRSLLDAYDALEAAHGVHLTAQLTLRTGSPADVMSALRAAPPVSLAGQPVASAEDLAAGSGGLPPSDVIVYRLAGARVVIRPSGTEPKLKVYFEIVQPAADGLGDARRAAAARLAPLRAAVGGLLVAS
jgi:phosphomannomutase